MMSLRVISVSLGAFEPVAVSHYLHERTDLRACSNFCAIPS